MVEKYIFSLGRRKAAVAKARVYKGKGKITINDKPALEYLSGNKTMLAEINDPLVLVGKEAAYDITIKVNGGGLAGQVDAIKLAIAKVLVHEASELRPILKKAGLLKRDPREKERKKYGLRSARKKEQFSKR
ncbi:MAG: 30S ribosomal protein S9 [Candidatus Nomurabacteria bacterium]|jgi:small subunit ribosomal protein S9|nr:30S ribosomal protein S9 [Candidatus Nomurabacteria bacterium]